MYEHPTMVRLSTAQREAMQALADADDRPLAYMIRKAVDQYVQAQRHEADCD